MRTFHTGFALLAALAAGAIAQTQPMTRPATSRSATTRSAATRPDADGLADPDYAVRDAAQLRLIESGASPELLDALAASTADPNALARIAAVRVAIRERDVTGPSRITIEGDALPVADALAELSRQSGGLVTLQEGQAEAAPAMISLHLRDASFWEALRAIGEATSCGASPDYNGGAGWVLAPHNPGVLGRVREGRFQEGDGFLIQATQLNYSRNVSFGAGGPSVSTQFSLQVGLLAEPKFRFEGNSQFVVRRAVDSAGNNLVESVSQSYGSSGQQLNFGIPLRYPAAPGQKIREVSGVFYVGTVSGVETLRSADLLAESPVSRDVGGHRVTIAATDSPAGLNLDVTVDNGASGSADVERIFNSFQRARLVGADGRPLRFAGYNRNSTPDGRATARVTFSRDGGIRAARVRVNGQPNAEPPAKPAGPVSLTLDLAVSTRQVEVPFTLRDLPMP